MQSSFSITVAGAAQISDPYIMMGQSGNQSEVDIHNTRTLESETATKDLNMQTRKIKHDVIGVIEARRCCALSPVYDTGEELFSATCDSRGVGVVGVLVHTNMAMNIDSFERPTTRVGRLRMRRCGSIQALTIFVAYDPVSSYKEVDVYCT
ncbi:hypothetical protein RB195_022989 [Necator americanus]|uniref:ZP domain-containing protein n=1 Tax=Necator americanus TaxID=51031 RepID=A0ABR1EJX9_NECAM